MVFEITLLFGQPIEQIVQIERITEKTVDKFEVLLSAKLRDNDPALRGAYLRAFVSEVRVSGSEIVICGPTAALEASVATGLPRKGKAVPIFDRKWCQKRNRTLSR